MVTTSSEHAFQSALKAKRSLVQQSAQAGKKEEATVSRKREVGQVDDMRTDHIECITLKDQRKVSSMWQRRDGISYHAVTFC